MLYSIRELLFENNEKNKSELLLLTLDFVTYYLSKLGVKEQACKGERMNRFLLLVLCVHWTVFSSSVDEAVAMAQEAARQSSRCNTHLQVLRGESRCLKKRSTEISEQYYIIKALEEQLNSLNNPALTLEEQDDSIGEVIRLKNLLPEDVCSAIHGTTNVQRNQTVIQQSRGVIRKESCAGLSDRAATVVAGLTVSVATAFVFTLGAMYGASK
jgi:hypothetical protein